MKKLAILFLAVPAAVAAAPLPAHRVALGKGARLPALLREVEAKYAKASTLSADFDETDDSAALHQTKHSSGTIQVKRPGKVRWETTKPDHNLLVSDGERFWFYTPPFEEGERGQYIEKKSSQVQSRLAQTLLSANFSSGTVSKTLRIHQDSPSLFTLTPTNGTAGSVLKATITIDPAQKLITRVVLEHRGGNRSEIGLSNIRLGQPLGDQTFQFTPPPGTDQLTE